MKDVGEDSPQMIDALFVKLNRKMLNMLLGDAGMQGKSDDLDVKNFLFSPSSSPIH